MKKLLAALVLTAAAACTGNNPVAPRVAHVSVAGVPTDLLVNPTRPAISGDGTEDVTLVVIVSVAPGTRASGVPVEIVVQSEETRQQRTERLMTLEHGTVMPVYRLFETTTFVVRAGGLTRTAVVTRTP